jgi:hypothetical protein
MQEQSKKKGLGPFGWGLVIALVIEIVLAFYKVPLLNLQAFAIWIFGATVGCIVIYLIALLIINSMHERETWKQMAQWQYIDRANERNRYYADRANERETFARLSDKVITRLDRMLDQGVRVEEIAAGRYRVIAPNGQAFSLSQCNMQPEHAEYLLAEQGEDDEDWEEEPTPLLPFRPR